MLPLRACVDLEAMAMKWYSTFPKASASYLLNPSAWAGYDTKSIFKRSLTGLNSALLESHYQIV